ncbi:sugar phosphate isomerase/epimerase family protein [Pseudomonas putida]|uniref:TIM barrel protein n=1 Tax=Pseudomonas putida TaxID=303 RepID=A0A8I1JKH4_PSEPU|nr:TIM barrel protein [Pseudomonas putida]MBI6885053.1 TIM barrel protein [Pseudomonas putida]
MLKKFYAQDTCFYNSMGVYSFEDRCEITKAAGYDATYLSVWDGRRWPEVHKLKTVKERYDLDVAGVYIVLNLALGAKSEANTGIYQMLKVIPEGSTVELAIKTVGSLDPSSRVGDDIVVDWLQEALVIAQHRNVRILIYSHYTHWSEKHDDALRICERINHPNLGIVFCGYHWFAADGENLAGTLKRSMPYLKQVNLSGARKSPLGWGGSATIETLDLGEMDNFALVALLNRLGYEGYLGWQGWGEGGDVFAKLERSLAALKSMTARAIQNPHWASYIDHA